MDKVIIGSLTVTADGFLWFEGMKLPCKLRAGGLEFFEKDPRRAAICGGPLFVVPFEAILALAQVNGNDEKDGEQ
jgi:hypothetical protein